MVSFTMSVALLGGLVFQFCRAAPSGQYSPASFSSCGKQTNNPLGGCPSNTIYVSQTDEKAKFSSIQAAISSIPNNTVPYTILIAPGDYIEQLNVTRYGPLTLLGMTDGSYLGPYANLDPNATWTRTNAVNVTWNSANNNAMFTDNAFTSVLTVAPNLDASMVGSGPTGFPVPDDTPFGSIDFKAYNIDFNNNYRPYTDGPAMAVAVNRANASFYSCGFYSWQDTVLYAPSDLACHALQFPRCANL
jgi:pectin methylesterase-like acyl-CoA thioesterase